MTGRVIVSEPYHLPERRGRRTSRDWAFYTREGRITEVRRFYTEKEAKDESDRVRRVRGGVLP
jgi:hypothetical protein